MRIVFDGRNWYGLPYLISAVRPETGDPSAPADLVVTMLRGDALSLKGGQAETLMVQLMAASVSLSVCVKTEPGEPGGSAVETYPHQVKLTEEPEEPSVVGPPEDH